MKRRRLSQSLALLAIAGAVYLFWYESQPRHKGRLVSFWVDQACRSREAKYQDEVLAIGLPAIPYLREKLRLRETRAGKVWNGFRNGLPDWIDDLLPEGASLPQIRDGAVDCLRRFGAEAAPAVPELIDLLPSRDSEGGRAVSALAAIGPAASNALPALHRELANQTSIQTLEIAWAISQIDNDVDPLILRLIDAMSQDKDDGMAMNAALGLEHVGPKASTATPALTRLLLSPTHSPGTRGNAAIALGNTNLAGDGITDALLAGLNDTSLLVSGNCAIALWRRDNRNAAMALPIVVDWLVDYNLQYPQGKMDLIKLAAHYHFNLKPLIPEFQKLLRDKSPVVRQIARETLEKIDPQSLKLGSTP